MKAVVMAGGEGSRLRPLTVDRPKPMVSIANVPVMEHIVLLLQRHGVRDIVATVHYMASVIQEYFREGQDLDSEIRYSIEDRPLGTAGSVRAARDHLDEPFFVISGDALTDFDLTAVADFHRTSGAAATLTLYRVPNPLEYGVVITDDAGRVLRFQEKPRWEEVIGDTVNTGIYLLDPEVLDLLPDGPADFSNDLFPEMLRRNMPLYGYVAEGYWTDVGSVDEYRRANADAVNGKAGIELPSALRGVMLEEGAEVHPEARLFGNILVGRDAQIRAGAIVNGPTVIGDYTVVDQGARIDESILLSNSYIGQNADLRSCIVGRQSSLHEGVRLEEGAVLGDNSVVGKAATVRSSVKIWPNKRIDDGAVVTSTIVHGSQARRSAFGRSGMTGLANIEMTPEFGAKVGAALGSVLRVGDRVVVNRDLSAPARMIKRALMAGLTSTGVSVLDVGALPISGVRYHTGVSDATAGVHVRSSPYEANSVDIKLLGGDASNIPGTVERSIDSVLAREDFRRVSTDQIAEIYVLDIQSDYSEELLRQLNLDCLRRGRPSLAVDYSGGAAEALLPAALNRAGCFHIAISGSEGKPEDLSRLARITASVGAAFGVRIDMDGKRIEVVDGTGRVLDDYQLTGAALSLFLTTSPGATICLPHRVPMALGRHLEDLGAATVWANSQAQSIMLASKASEAAVGTDGTGAFCFPGFHIGFDGLLGTLKLAETLAVPDISLADVVDSLPDVWQVRRDVLCPWERRAAVMQALNDPGRPRLGEFPDGLVYGDRADGSRIVVLPMSDSPTIVVLAEADDGDEANSLAAKWERLLIKAQE